MGDSLVMENLEEKIAPLDMESFINMLWDQDMDMGVDRQFYDPVLRDQELKKQEAEQNRLLELRKKQAKQEMLYFTIDEETGERIPKPSAGPYQPPSEFTDADLSKELAELGEIADFNYLLNDDIKNPQNDTDQLLTDDCNQQHTQQQPRINDYNMIIQTAGQPNPVSDIDLWPTEITMLPGPSDDNSSSSIEESDMFMSQIWGMDRTSSSSEGFFESYNESVEAPPPYQSYGVGHDDVVTMTGDVVQHSRYQPAVVAPHNPYVNNDSAFSSLDGCINPYGSGEASSYCSRSTHSHTDSEDVKPQVMFSGHGSISSLNEASSSANSSAFSGSENEENFGMTKAEQEKERRSACRDELRCKELGIPFTVEMITNYPVEEFNSLLRQHRLSEEQLSLVKDIRRRGKNKVAAQNCRKKKMNELTGLEVEINDLKRKRSELMRDKDDLKRSKLHLRKQLDQTYAEVFNSIRDHLGRPYDPRFYTLHISDDGDARVIPNKVSTYAVLNYHQAA